MHVQILGTRGLPAKHGGFETFAQDLSLFLVARGHAVTVYCQDETGNAPHEDEWNGIRRVMIPAAEGSRGSLAFDWMSVAHAAKTPGVALTLGYNTGVFNFRFRASKKPNAMNMDGIEWRREKWSLLQRLWLWFNEWAGARASQHLVADHPEIGKHLLRHTSAPKITVIPYGADQILSAPIHPVAAYGLASKSYDLVIARPEPENSILEIVKAHGRSIRPYPLVMLGNYSGSVGEYQKRVVEAAASNVMFLGAIYDRDTVAALRFHSRLYIHGHRVGGTNPSLVESLGTGSAIVAHDNRFTRWVAGPGARYFKGVDDLAKILDRLDSDPHQVEVMGASSRKQHELHFTKNRVLANYEKLLTRVAAAREAASPELRKTARSDAGRGFPEKSDQGRAYGQRREMVEIDLK